MATEAHCAYCFESLSSSLEKRQPLSLRQTQVLWDKYSSGPTTNDVLGTEDAEDDDRQSQPSATDSPYKPAAISRLIAPSPSSASSSNVPSGSSTPGVISDASSATSKSSSRSSFFSRPRKTETETVEEHPLFVTWNTVTKRGETRLRGCIGTFEAQHLEEGLKSYALTSAFDDTRFHPISARELPTLECAVTLLTDFEPASHPLDWTIGTHGLRISFTHHSRRYGSTYLPNIAAEQGWTKEETLVSLMRKAGWNGRKEDWKKMDVNVVRYQGKKVELGYDEWKEWRSWVDEEIADS